MKFLYQKILDLLGTTDLAFIDLDSGQLESGKTEVAWPCALVNLTLPDCEDVTDRIQRVTCRLILRIGFQPYQGQTANITPENVRNTSLQFFDLMDHITNNLQGFTDSNIEGISRVGLQQEQRSDGLRVFQLAFDIRYEEDFN